MKNFVVLLTLLAILGVGIFPATAQTDDQCAAEVEDWQEDAVKPLIDAYEAVDNDVDDIESAAELQAARREFNMQDSPDEALLLKSLFIRMADLRIDAIIERYLDNDGQAETLQQEAEDIFDIATAMLDDLCPKDGDPQVEFTTPEDGGIVSRETLVEGTYDPDGLGDNEIWIVLLTQGSVFHPQVIIDQDCTEQTSNSVTYGPRPGTWRIAILIGGDDEDSIGKQFDIIAYIAEPDEHEAMVDLMADWCRDENWPGLPDVASEFGLEFYDSIRVTRE